MKILKVVHSFIPYTTAGTEVYTYNLARELSKRNNIFIFFRINEPKKKEYVLRNSILGEINLYSINNTFRKCDDFRQTYANPIIDKIFGSLLDEIEPDIVHIQHLLFLSFGLILEAKKRGIPVIFTLNDYWLFCHRGQLIKDDLSLCDYPSVDNCKVCIGGQLYIRKNTMLFYNLLRKNLPNCLLQTIKKLYLSYARASFFTEDKVAKEVEDRFNYVKEVISIVDKFIAPSNFIKDKFVILGIPPERIIFSHYGLDYKRFLSILKTPCKKLRFGYIGTLLPTKGVDVLITAFKLIKNQSCELLIYGRLIRYAGYEFYPKYLKNIAKDERRIKFMGGFDNENIANIMANIDTLVIPSIWYENSPLVIYEAFLSKTPVIASRIGGIPELVKDRINGLLFKPNNPKDLYEKMTLIVDNPYLIERMKENIRP
ncbi:MAG: glycosyltransferase family 4 protein, partial [Candidatus Omnitrophica bacterium]|nr:glycosyltransferase family 4 protein [Candidatus Omnitrophota bacterium]